MTEIDFGKTVKQDRNPPSPLDGPGVAPDPAWFEQPAAEPPFARYVLTTPLHLVAASESRTNAWTEWNGYTVADVYTNAAQEYEALRARVGLSDMSPLVKYRVSGKEAVAYLDRLLTGAVGALRTDTVTRAVLCAGDGNVVTEGLLFRMGDQEFRLVVGSSHLDWLLASAEGFEVQVEDVSGTIAALSLAGPFASAVLAAAGIEGAETLAAMTARWAEPGRMPVYVSRTGILGGLAYELWVDPEDAPILWRRLMESGKQYAIAPVGRAAANVARLENGVALEGVDYHSALTATDPAEMRSPFDLGLGGLVDLDRETFNGRKALAEIAAGGCRQVVIGLEVDAPDTMPLEAIYIGDSRAGRVTSSVWSPRLQRHIALAVIEGEGLGASDGFAVGAAHRKPVPATLIKRPFLRFSGDNASEK